MNGVLTLRMNGLNEKVIGFSINKVLSLKFLQNLIFSVIGVILGLGLIYATMNTSGNSLDMMVKISDSSFFICAGVTIGASLLVSLLFRKKY